MAIVCGIDFSDTTPSVLRGAGALALGTREDVLYIVHVIDTQALARLTVDEQAKLRADVGERMAAEAFDLSQRFKLAHVHPTVLVGSPSAALIDFAQFNRASWLVVASAGHGSSPLYRLSGASERVAVEARVPVLVIRDASSLEVWARGERPLRIVVGVDWTRSSDAAIGAVRALRQCGACDVVVAHVYDRDEAAARYGIALVDPSRDGDSRDGDRIPELLLRDLVRRIGELGGTGSVSFRPSVGMKGVGDDLLQLADAEKADLLVVGTHHRRDLERLTSVSSLAIHAGRTSIACVPRSAGAEDAPRQLVRRILVAADVSSHHVAEQAYALAGNCGGEVHLVHVIGNDEARENPAATEAELRSRLRSLAPRWASEKGIVTQVEIIRSRDLARTIAETAARVGADMICVGSHEKAGIMSRRLGSTAKAIVQRSELPVLIVRPLPP